MNSTTRGVFGRGTVLFGLAGLVACGGEVPPPVTPPPARTVEVTPPPKPEAPPPPAKEDPFAITGTLRPEPRPPVVGRDVSSALEPAKGPNLAWKKAIPAPPAVCKAYGEKPKKKPAIACDTFLASAPGKNDGAGTLLAEALAEPNAEKRDARLRELVACKGIPEAELAALRGTLAPPECADTIVAPFAESSAKLGALDKRLAHTIVGLWLAGNLARAVPAIPRMSPPFTKEAVAKFTQGPIKTWFSTQATAVDELSKLGASLEGQGRAIVAIEAGLADMRFVERAREVPIPDAWKKDPEIAQIYQQALDQAMEPRKVRGRDAALTGLHDSASLGIVQDARVARARQLLSKLYGGSRIDGLDGLLLPPRPEAKGPATLEHTLLRRLPFSFGERLVKEPAHDAAYLDAVLDQGLPPAFRGTNGVDVAHFERLARARLELGKLYFRTLEADQVLALAKGNEGKLTSDDARFYVALALALRHGPEGAAAMMKAPSPAALALRHTEALDELAKGSGPNAGLAAFDAAWLRMLSPAEGAGADYFTDVARRFREAEAKLVSPADKQKARERAALAEETAKAAK
ncbi:MAG: hypothetical protein U0183_13160 [Polyangiaceae bacterium]